MTDQLSMLNEGVPPREGRNPARTTERQTAASTPSLSTETLAGREGESVTAAASAAVQGQIGENGEPRRRAPLRGNVGRLRNSLAPRSVSVLGADFDRAHREELRSEDLELERELRELDQERHEFGYGVGEYH